MQSQPTTANQTRFDSLAALRRQWPQLAETPVLRAERVAALVRAGLSRRALARALQVDEGTIRRDLKIARLPAEQKTAVEQGTNRAAALRDAAAGRRAAERTLIEQCADLIVAWVKKRHLWPACAEQLVMEADLRLWRVQSKTEAAAARPLTKHAQIIAGCCPRTPLPSEMEFLVEWLVRWARRLMPDRQVREQAFALALSRVREAALRQVYLPGPGNQRFLQWLRQRAYCRNSLQ